MANDDSVGLHSPIAFDERRMSGIDEDFDPMMDYHHGGAFDEEDENEEEDTVERGSSGLLLVNDHTNSSESITAEEEQERTRMLDRNGQQFMAVDVVDDED